MIYSKIFQSMRMLSRLETCGQCVPSQPSSVISLDNQSTLPQIQIPYCRAPKFPFLKSNSERLSLFSILASFPKYCKSSPSITWFLFAKFRTKRCFISPNNIVFHKSGKKKFSFAKEDLLFCPYLCLNLTQFKSQTFHMDDIYCMIVWLKFYEMASNVQRWVSLL